MGQDMGQPPSLLQDVLTAMEMMLKDSTLSSFEVMSVRFRSPTL